MPGMTGRGVLPLIKLPKNAKITGDNYVKYILEPYFETYLPKLYPKDMQKLIFHHDMASSHTSNVTTEFLQKMKAKYGIDFLDKKDIPVKGPDISPLDFFGFGFLKQRAKQCSANTLEDL